MLLNLPDLPHPIDFAALFGGTAPVEIEIGVGKGRFLRERAAAFPDRHFLGIEKSKKWLMHAAARLEKAGLTRNVRLLQCYAEGFLERYVPDASVTTYHILFPDPWPKRSHEKRRLFNAGFISQMMRTLAPEGEFHLATDYSDYFDTIRREFDPFAGKGFKLEPAAPGPFLSNFQVKYAREGRPLYFAKARRDYSCSQVTSNVTPPRLSSQS